MTPVVAPSTPIEAALALAEAQPDVRAAASALRQHYPNARIVVVDAFDMRAEKPAAQGPSRALYLGASDGHCWSVTADPAEAVGLFLS